MNNLQFDSIIGAEDQATAAGTNTADTMINLDQKIDGYTAPDEIPYKPALPDLTKETDDILKEMGQGDYQQNEYDLNSDIDNLLDQYEYWKDKEWNEKTQAEWLKNLSKEERKEYDKKVLDFQRSKGSMTAGLIKSIQIEKEVKKYRQELFNEFRNNIKNDLTNKRNELAELKDNKKYDRRTEEEKRADSTNQRAVEDLKKAGLNPGLMFGGGGGGGIGGGGQREQEEEKKRRRKKKEEEEAAKKQKEMLNSQMITTLLTSVLGGASRGIGYGIGGGLMGTARTKSQKRKTDSKSESGKRADEFLNSL